MIVGESEAGRNYRIDLVMTRLNRRDVDEFWHRIELYVQAVASALESRIGAERAN